ncbi:dihydrofolate reductase family protein [Lentzea sp. NPDC042327]|uniref:RibD family protein n=1 Tax=Lentzea sp. NPDC042327 TaxID=3154801 RepID=UPI003405F4B9
MTRPHVLLSVAVSLDGHIDDRGTERFPLSNAEDFDHVDRMRAESDAVLVGAETLRRDNARLLVYSEERRARRVAGGKPEFPLRVTVTRSGRLDPGLRFWHCGGERLVYSQAPVTTVGHLAETKTFGELPEILDDLGERGVRKLMVEGGTSVHTAFLSAGLADEIRVAVAPMLIGQATAPRFVNPAEFPGGPARRFHLEDVEKVGDVAVLRYFPKVTSSSRG